MFGINYEALNPALELFRANSDVLHAVAQQSVVDFGFEHHEVVVVCAVYNNIWKELIDSLCPDAESQARSLQESGHVAISIAATTHKDFAEYLSDAHVEIEIPKMSPTKDKVWSLFLHEKGHAWLMLSTETPSL